MQLAMLCTICLKYIVYIMYIITSYWNLFDPISQQVNWGVLAGPHCKDACVCLSACGQVTDCDASRHPQLQAVRS